VLSFIDEVPYLRKKCLTVKMICVNVPAFIVVEEEAEEQTKQRQEQSGREHEQAVGQLSFHH
jgi:hypothetical protein